MKATYIKIPAEKLNAKASGFLCLVDTKKDNILPNPIVRPTTNVNTNDCIILLPKQPTP